MPRHPPKMNQSNNQNPAMKRILTACCLTIFLAFTPAHSQVRDESIAPNQIEVSFRTIVLSGSFHETHPEIRLPGGTLLPITTHGTHLSKQVYRYVGPNPIVVYLDERPVADIHVPEDMTEAFFLFYQRPSGETDDGPQYQVETVYADAGRFPWGSYMFTNSSGLNLEVLLDGHNVALPPAARELVRIDGEEARTVAARFFVVNNGDKVRHQQLAWYFQPEVRRLVLVTRDDDVDRSLRIRTVADRNTKRAEMNMAPSPPQQ